MRLIDKLKEKKMKDNKGITLVVLTITIIVLIVLAALSVRMITSTEIVNETIDLKNGYESLSQNEEQRLDSLKEKVLTGTY